MTVTPAEGPRQVAEMVRIGIEGINLLSMAMIAGAVAAAALVVWIALGSAAETIRNRRRK